MTDKTRYTCPCKVCGGFAFEAPVGLIPDGKHHQAMVHNYAQMVRNPAMAAVMAAKGLRKAA